MSDLNQLTKWAMEIQALSQTGIEYSKDVYHLERFERLREISAEILSSQTDLPIEKVKDLFCDEIGYQTPKLETRAAIFKDNKILLVQEKDGRWSLPGGWVDIGVSVKENTIKEVYEEAGIDVSADYIIAIQDRDKHNLPIYIHKVCKVFVYCSYISGEFKENIETINSGYYSFDELPEPIATSKNSYEQIKMCFDAHLSKDWTVLFD